MFQRKNRNCGRGVRDPSAPGVAAELRGQPGPGQGTSAPWVQVAELEAHGGAEQQSASPTVDSACQSWVCACWAGSLGTSSLMEQGSGGTEEFLAQVGGGGWTQPAVDPAHAGLQSTGQRTMEFPRAPPPPRPRSSCKRRPRSDSRNQERSHQMQTEAGQEDPLSLCRGKHQPL